MFIDFIFHTLLLYMAPGALLWLMAVAGCFIDKKSSMIKKIFIVTVYLPVSLFTWPWLLKKLSEEWRNGL